jgi:hypothetical protein
MSSDLFAAHGPSLTLSKTIAHRGDRIDLLAQGLSSGQVVDIQWEELILSETHADQSGTLAATIYVPGDAPIGEGTVGVCSQGDCFLTQTIQITS